MRCEAKAVICPVLPTRSSVAGGAREKSVSDRPEDDARKGQRHKDGYALKTWDAMPGILGRYVEVDGTLGPF